MLKARARTRRWRTAAVAAAVVPCLTPAASVGQGPISTTTFVLRRTTTGPTSYDLQVSVRNDSRGSFIGVVGAAARGGRVTMAEAQMSGSAGRWKNSTLTVGDTQWSTCEVGVCHDHAIEGYHGMGSTFDDPTGDDPITHIFVVLVGRDPNYAFKATGWKLVKTRFSFRYLDGGETSPAYSKVNFAGAETFLDGSLPGGRHGSLAIGIPPCSTAAVGLVPRGAGTLTLDGGAEPEYVTCPVDRLFPASYATRATTWRFHGAVAGDSTNRDTRLFVVDLPARLP